MSDTGPLPLFVYGTLRDADVLGLVLGRSDAGAGRQPARAPGLAAIYMPGRTYPVLVRQRGAVAPGLLLTGLTTSDLDRLDRFEGTEYARRPVDVRVNGLPARAEAYWPAQELPPGGEPWRLGDWRLRHKAALLAAESANLNDLRRRLTDLTR